MQINLFKNIYLKVFALILISLFVDNLLLSKFTDPPPWDQGYHLSNVFKMYNILDENNLDFSKKINLLLNITDSYRGPLTYFLSALFLKIFNNSYLYAYLSNQVFNIICIFSILNLGKLFKNKSVGIWASIIFTFSMVIINLRSDYLIDLSLTGFTTLNLFFFTKWYLNKKSYSLLPLLSGISLALVFLVKPTSIVLFFFPFLVIITNLIKNQKNYYVSVQQIFLFLISFVLIIFPWFSRHWLTIITSTLNAWNWGINYQDGLDFKDLNSWFYYFKKLPYLFGITNFSIFATIFLIEKTFQKNLLKINFQKFKKIEIFFLVFLFNCYLITSLMSTKDIRFILPLYPLLCIYLSTFINSNIHKFFTKNIKKIILIISISISIVFSKNGLIYKNQANFKSENWPHSDIIQTIKNDNPGIISTLAILPDTKEINTFNLEAEASRQDEYVVVRQIISNKETYKQDLSYFDWFLVKTGSQGVMTNEAKDLLNKYLLNSSSFRIYKDWNLPDKSKVLLLRRNFKNTNLINKDCSFNNEIINFEQINNGIRIKMIDKGKNFISSNLLIDFIGEKYKKSDNISIANDYFHKNFDYESCYELTQDIPIDFPTDISESLEINARLLDNKGKIKPLYISNRNLVLDPKFIDNDYILMANRISKVKLLGNYLREGEFKNLFDLVGIINQSDPKQIYLKQAEKIYTQRFKDKKNLEDQYSILISQILQRKANKAKKTIESILETDLNNGNTYLAKSIINVYLFDKKNARSSINRAKKFDKSLESDEILKSIEGLNYLLEMKILEAYKTFNNL